MAENSNFKICIEASAYSLEEINKIDNFFLKKLRILINNKKVEFIGSGYCQAIFPLIPFEMNKKNLQFGNEIYKKLLGFKPTIALINEQIFSKSLIPIYKHNGYKAIVIDWKNCKLANNKLNDNLEFSPKSLKFRNDTIKIIWANSLNFQKFQNYVHGEISEDNFLKFINKISKPNRNICIYSNDVEIFNFRPGRFLTESKIHDTEEWYRIEKIFKKITKNNSFIFLSELLKKNRKNKLISIFNSKNPIVTKKQPKYNIIRWSLAGRDSLYINTLCFRIFNYLNSKKIKNKNIWKKLCFFWSSDFRTHITNKKWNLFLKEIHSFSRNSKIKKFLKIENKKFEKCSSIDRNKIKILKQKNFLSIQTNNIEINLNIKKGLTIESYTDHKIADIPIIGKIEKGFFNQIDRDVDFFSGFFLLYDRVNNKKITDLSQNAEKFIISSKDNFIIRNKFKFGKIIHEKNFIFDFQKRRFAIKNIFKNFPIGFLRFNYITLNPNNFNHEKLFYETNNGGYNLEKFDIKKMQFDHGEHVSSLCSATTGLGSTNGIVIIGDDKKRIRITNDNTKSALIPMIKNEKISKKNLFRFYQSAMEYDDTSKPNIKKNFETITWFKFLN